MKQCFFRIDVFQCYLVEQRDYSFRPNGKSHPTIVHRIIMTVLLLIIPVSLFSQSAKIDGLRAVLKKHARDTVRVNALISLCDAYRSNDYAKAALHGNEALNLAKKLGFQRGISRAHVSLGTLMYDRHEVTSSLEHLTQGLKIAEEVNDANTIAQALLVLASITDKQGNYEKAMSYAQRALHVCEESSNQSGIATTLNNIGGNLLDRGKYEPALEYYQRSLNIQEKLGDPVGTAKSLVGIGSSLSRQGKRDQGIDYCLRGLKLQEEHGAKSDMAISLNNLGLMYKNNGNYEQALDCLQRSLILSEELGMKELRSGTVRNIGIVYKTQGKYEQALEYYKRSLKLSEESGHKAGAAAALGNIGVILTHQGRYEEALDSYQRSLSLGEQLGDNSVIGTTLGNIAKIYLNQNRYEQSLEYSERSLKYTEAYGGCVACILNNIALVHSSQRRYEKALDYLRRALKLREENGEKAGIAEVLVNIGNIYSKQRQYDQAMEYYQRSLNLGQDLKNEYHIALLLNNIGLIFQRQGLYGKAEAHYLHALNIGIETGSTDVKKASYEFLSELESTRGDFAKAFEYHKKLVALKDSLLNETNMKSINEMTARYESEKKEQQIALLEKDKALQSSELERKQKELVVQQLEAERNRQHVEILTHDHTLQTLELHHSQTELALKSKDLALQKADKEKKQKEVALLKKDNELQASVAGGEKNFRNALLITLVLLLAVGFLIIKRVKAKRTEASLRAEAAEFEARALKAETIALISETERRRKEEMELFAHRLIQSQEQERARIARELHDSLGQELLVIKNQAHMAMQQPSRVDEICDRMQRVKDVALEMLDEIRQLSRNLRPVQLERSGLSSTIREMLQQVEDSGTVKMNAIIVEIDGLFGKDDEINVYRILQESMNNILKHSEAKNVSVEVRRSNGDVHIRMQDDGRGFHLVTDPRMASSFGMGLQSMQERVQILKGVMHIESAPGRGTKIDVRLPVYKLETSEV